MTKDKERFPRTALGRAALGLAVVCGAWFAVPASPLAQDKAAASSSRGDELLSDPRAVGECLCLERRLQALGGNLGAERKAYEEAKAQLDELRATIESRRPQVNVGNPAEVDAFKNLVLKEEALQTAFRDTVVPRYDERVRGYNAVVGAFDRQCRSRPYNLEVVLQIQGSLNCPAAQ